MVLDDKSRTILEELCRKHGAKKLILFGSRARGDCHERSDIDIAVEGISNASEYLDLVDDIDDSDIIYSREATSQARACSHLATAARVKYPAASSGVFDLVDVVNLDSMLVSAVIVEEIEKDGVVLYEEISASAATESADLIKEFCKAHSVKYKIICEKIMQERGVKIAEVTKVFNSMSNAERLSLLQQKINAF